MLLQFRQGLVQVQAPMFFKVTFPYVDLLVTDTNTIVSFAAGTKDYLYTEQESVTQAWGPLTLGRDQWLYWDLDTRTGRRSFGITLHEPVTSHVAPTSPVTDQHWFDLSTGNMCVWSGHGWLKRIRTFAVKLSGGKVPVSMSINSPAYTGTQVGITTGTYAGHIMFDATTNNAIRDSSGMFVTSEDQLSTKSISLSEVKLASIIIEGEAQQNMAAHTVVVFSEFGKIVHADQFTAEQTRHFGIIESSAVVGQTVSVTNHGMVSSSSWDWSAAGVNALVYCDAAGALTTTPVIPNQIPVGEVLDRHTIILGSPLVQAAGGADVAMATQEVFGISRLSVPAEDESDPIVVGDNDPRLTNARPPAFHTHPIEQVIALQAALDDKVDIAGDVMTGYLELNADPVEPMHAATKQYVDAHAAAAAGTNYQVQYNVDGQFAASAAFTFTPGTVTTPNTAVLEVGNYEFANAVIHSSTELLIEAGGIQDAIAHNLVLQGGSSLASGDVVGEGSIRAGDVWVRGGWAVNNIADASHGGNAYVVGGTGFTTNGDVTVRGGEMMNSDDGTSYADGGNVTIAGGGTGTTHNGGTVTIAGGAVNQTGDGIAGNIRFVTNSTERLLISDRGEWILNGIDHGAPGQVLMSRGSISPTWGYATADVPINTIRNATGGNYIYNGAMTQQWNWDLNYGSNGLELKNLTGTPNTISPYGQNGANATMYMWGKPNIDNISDTGLSQSYLPPGSSDNIRTVGLDEYMFGGDVGYDGTIVPAGWAIPRTTGDSPENAIGYIDLTHNSIGTNSWWVTCECLPISYGGGRPTGTIGIFVESQSGYQSIRSGAEVSVNLEAMTISLTVDGNTSDQTFSSIHPNFVMDPSQVYVVQFSMNYGGTQSDSRYVGVNVYSKAEMDLNGSAPTASGSFNVTGMSENVEYFKFGYVGLLLPLTNGGAVAVSNVTVSTDCMGMLDRRPGVLALTSDTIGVRPMVVYNSIYDNESLSVTGSGQVTIGGMAVEAEETMLIANWDIIQNSNIHARSVSVVVDGGSVTLGNDSYERIIDNGDAIQYQTLYGMGGTVILRGGHGVWNQTSVPGFPVSPCSSGGSLVLFGGVEGQSAAATDSTLPPGGGDVLLCGGDINSEDQLGIGGNVHIRGGVGSINGHVRISAGIEIMGESYTFGNTTNAELMVADTQVSFGFPATGGASAYIFSPTNIELNGTLGSTGRVISHDGTSVVWADPAGGGLDGYTVAQPAHNVTALGVGSFGSHRYFESNTVDNNTAIGNYALGSLTVGIRNTAVGTDAMRLSTHYYVQQPYDNVAVGYQSGYKLRGTSDGSAFNNVAVGARSLANATLAQHNAMIGAKAGETMGSGSYNVMIGSNSGQALTTCLSNTLVGDSTYPYATTGGYNTALGASALSMMQSGSVADALSNATGIGNNAKVSGSNQVQLGNSSTTTYVYGTVQNRSDERDKADIRPTVLGIDFINKIDAVDFKWDMRDDYLITTHTTDENGVLVPSVTHLPKDGTKKRNRYHHGVIAQQVKQVCDDLGVDFGGYQHHSINDGDDTMTIGYDEFIAPLISSVQYLYSQNQELRQIIMEMQTKLATL